MEPKNHRNVQETPFSQKAPGFNGSIYSVEIKWDWHTMNAFKSVWKSFGLNNFNWFCIAGNSIFYSCIHICIDKQCKDVSGAVMALTVISVNKAHCEMSILSLSLFTLLKSLTFQLTTERLNLHLHLISCLDSVSMFNWIGLGSSVLITTTWDKFPSSTEFRKFEVYPVHVHPPLWCSNCSYKAFSK